MMPTPSSTEAPALDRRRNPHIWSWFLKLVEECSLPSLAVKLFGLLVEWSALLDNCKTLDVQSLAGLLEGCGSVPRLGLADLAGKDMTPCELGRDWLLLHRFHCLHGSHRLHCLHCLHSFGHC